MQKLLDYILKRWIDSYCLLIVKFHLNGPIKHKSYLIDLLDWLDYAAYDAGPGQLMLRESDFYAAHERGSQPEKLDVSAKVEKLFACFEEGIRSLFNNRKKRLARQRGLFKTFTNAGNYSIDQSQMRFAP